MTKQGSFKKVVRRHAKDTGQRYTEALADLEGVGDRMAHTPTARELLAHAREAHGVDATAATKLSQHNDRVWRIDLADGQRWVARVYGPSRPRAGVDGDAAILRFLEAQAYPAERVAAETSAFDGSTVILTRFIDGELLPSPAVGDQGPEKMRIMGDLLGRLHALPRDESSSRPGGASGEDPAREGSPQQDVLSALALLDAVDTKVAPETRPLFEALREDVRSADAGDGLPEALVHGNLLHAPDHIVVERGAGPVAINWRAAGRGPRLSDLAYILWGCWLDEPSISAALGAYRQHVELTDDELDRMAGVMLLRPAYLCCFDWRRTLLAGRQPQAGDRWARPDTAYIAAAAGAVRAAWQRAG
ncbi:MAG TPA: hypothetical protein VEA78_08010 [Acidimicrobiales bacterium]|nr:hypothetical protein [Acidimicrobiales bacterium]